MKVIEIKDCTGKNPSCTLKHQLIAAGVIKDSTGWGGSHSSDTTSVFYHFKHYASAEYIPDSVCVASPNEHCGVCFHAINYKFCFKSVSGRPFTMNWRDKDGEEYGITYPATMNSGSECINLANELKSLTHKYIKDCNVPRIDFHDGRICANTLIQNASDWEKDYEVFPLEWVYFDEILRDRLVWYQYKRHVGAHIEDKFDGETVIARMNQAYQTYKSNRDVEEEWIRSKDHSLLARSPLRRAEMLFYGKNKFGQLMTRKSIGDHACEPYKYVILTREQAIQII